MAKILVIDDEEGIRRHFEKLLTRRGHEVITAEDGEEGLELAADPEVKLIITDYQLPGALTKTEMVRTLRELRPELPLMVISGYADMEIVNECEALGVRDVLTKPFELSFVTSIIQKELGGTE